MTNILLTIVLIVLQIYFTNCRSPLQKVMLDKKTYPEAQCLDGSQAGFYFQEGHGLGQDKFIIFFQGGGACIGPNKDSMYKSCVERSKTPLGSSKEWPQEYEGQGVLQDSSENNPEFYNWNKIYINYCDGTMHQGYVSKALEYEGEKFYIKGYQNSIATFDYILKNTKIGQKDTTEVLLIGTSAGGLGTYYYSDYLKSLLNKNTKFWGAPDSGFFINYYETNTSIMAKSLNLLVDTFEPQYVQPPNCQYINDPENKWKCVIPEFFAANIKADLFIIQSEYDEFTLKNFVGINCIEHASMQNCNTSQIQTMQHFREQTVSKIRFILDQKQNANAWLVSCIRHSFTADSQVYNSGIYEVPMNSNNTPQVTLKKWMYASQSQKQNYINDVYWPLNIPCNGIEDSLY